MPTLNDWSKMHQAPRNPLGQPIVSAGYMREIGHNLDAWRLTPSPSPIFDPEIGVTTDHDQGVW